MARIRRVGSTQCFVDRLFNLIRLDSGVPRFRPLATEFQYPSLDGRLEEV
jgi:hypothetical protein